MKKKRKQTLKNIPHLLIHQQAFQYSDNKLRAEEEHLLFLFHNWIKFEMMAQEDLKNSYVMVKVKEKF